MLRKLNSKIVRSYLSIFSAASLSIGCEHLSLHLITMEFERSKVEIRILIDVYIQNVVVGSGSPALFKISSTVQRTHPGVLCGTRACEAPPIL